MERVFSSKLTFAQTQELGKLLKAARQAVTAMQRVGGCQAELPTLSDALKPFEGIAEDAPLTEEQHDARRSVLYGMALLAATNAPQAVYQHVPGGKAAWDALVTDGLIVQHDGFWILGETGRAVLKN